MYSITAFNSISDRGLDILTNAGFHVSEGSYDANAEGIILRSRQVAIDELRGNVLAIARAGAGTNNIPIDECSSRGILVFNTPGANANAVKELVAAGLLLSGRKIVDGINWVNENRSQSGLSALVEKEKARFQGPELAGKKICVVGLGAIGVMVANLCQALGMDVYGYDPFMTVDAAWGLSRSVHRAMDMQQILSVCDFVTLHTPLNDATRRMFNGDFFPKMKQGARLLNFSRAEIVDFDCLAAALKSGALACYVTDFPCDVIMRLPNVIAIPHLGASTPESEENCAEMAASHLRDYLLTGSITNSVNFPDMTLQPLEKTRLTVLHSNIPNMIGQITSVIYKYGLNIDNMANRNRGAFACTIADIDTNGADMNSVKAEISQIDSVSRVRVLC